MCLGYFCVGEEDFPYRKKIIEGLLDSAAVSAMVICFCSSVCRFRHMTEIVHRLYLQFRPNSLSCI